MMMMMAEREAGINHNDTSWIGVHLILDLQDTRTHHAQDLYLSFSLSFYTRWILFITLVLVQPRCKSLL